MMVNMVRTPGGHTPDSHGTEGAPLARTVAPSDSAGVRFSYRLPLRQTIAGSAALHTARALHDQ